jgi:hypothetical protein
MHDLYWQINAWMTKHPGLTALYTFSYLAALLVCWHFVSQWLTMILFFAFGGGNVFIMLCDTIYLIKSNYQPPRCEKCGQVLPEERQ